MRFLTKIWDLWLRWQEIDLEQWTIDAVRIIKKIPIENWQRSPKGVYTVTTSKGISVSLYRNAKYEPGIGAYDKIYLVVDGRTVEHIDGVLIVSPINGLWRHVHKSSRFKPIWQQEKREAHRLKKEQARQARQEIQEGHRTFIASL